MSGKHIAAAFGAGGAALASFSAQAESWVLSGAAASFVDVSKLVRESVDERAVEHMRGTREDGGSIWLDLKGATSESDTAVGGVMGWDNDIYAVNLGADIKKGDTFFGVVYTYANSDGDSSLHTPYSSYKAQTETDFFGVTIFGEQKFGSVGIFGSLGWLHARGDVKYASAGGDLAAEIDDDMHGDVWTADIGVRGTASFGALSLVPYAKAELTYLAPDNYAFGEPDNLRFYQFPVGVNAAWTFEAAGWELTPVVDLAVIPTAGDTKAEGKYAGERYDESFYSDGTYWRAALGISARGEHGVFGLSYRYLDGADGYKMHSFGARAEYVF